MRSATRLAAVVLLAFALTACSKITPENYARIQDGMTEAEVIAILGKPDKSANVTLVRLKAVNSTWVGSDQTITVQFVNARVRAKTLAPTEPAGKK